MHSQLLNDLKQVRFRIKFGTSISLEPFLTAGPFATAQEAARACIVEPPVLPVAVLELLAVEDGVVESCRVVDFFRVFLVRQQSEVIVINLVCLVFFSRV